MSIFQDVWSKEIIFTEPHAIIDVITHIYSQGLAWFKHIYSPRLQPCAFVECEQNIDFLNM